MSTPLPEAQRDLATAIADHQDVALARLVAQVELLTESAPPDRATLLAHYRIARTAIEALRAWYLRHSHLLHQYGIAAPEENTLCMLAFGIREDRL